MECCKENAAKPAKIADVKKSTQKQNNPNRRSEVLGIDELSPIIQAFRIHQVELDQRYDKYERIVKKSRDITIESKKIIFLLHRITSEENKRTVIDDAKTKLESVRMMHFKAIALELRGEDFYKFTRAFSPGLQEYVEAVTYLSYLDKGKIATLEEIQEDLYFDYVPIDPIQIDNEEIQDVMMEKVTMPLPQLEYILGLADLSGELMRRCINSVGQGDFEEPLKVSELMRQLYDGFVSIGNLAGRDVSQKTNVLKQSLRKVENACYELTVRQSEIPKNSKFPKHIIENMFSAVHQQDD